jgi:pyruvate dehydrogenase E1 component beta subunit
MPEQTIVESIRQALELELDRDQRTILLGQDIGRLGGVFRATEGLQERFGPDRVVDTPLAEAAIIGSSLGLAVSGMVPVAELQFFGFGAQGYHQIVDQVARYRYRSRGRFTVPLTIRAPFGAGVKTPELHSDGLEARYANAPGIKVVAPSTPHDAKGMLLAAIRDPDPVLYLEPLKGYRLVRGEVPDAEYLVELGVASVVRTGTHVTLITWSAAVQVCEQAAESAAAEGIECTIVDLRSIVPLDVPTIVEAVEATGRAVVVQEGSQTAGFASEIVTTIQEEAFYSLEAPIERVTGPDVPYPPFTAIEPYYAPDAERVLQAIRRTLEDS